MIAKTLKGVEILCEIIKETDGAVLIDEGSSEHWIPKSQIININVRVRNTHRGEKDTTTIVIPEWLAYERGLI